MAAAKKSAGKSAAPTKSQTLATIAEKTGVSKKDAGAVLDALGGIVKKSVKGNGSYTVPGLMKITVVKKPATKARKGVNPFTGQEMMFKAKPARNVIKIRALKALKDAV